MVIGSKRPLLATMHRVRVLQTIHGGMARRRWEIAELLVMAMIKEGTMSESTVQPMKIERLVTLRDDTYQAPDYDRQLDQDATQVALDLVDANAFLFAVRSIRWGNYPGLKADEVVSASLDGYFTASTLRGYRASFRRSQATRAVVRKVRK